MGRRKGISGVTNYGLTWLSCIVQAIYGLLFIGEPFCGSNISAYTDSIIISLDFSLSSKSHILAFLDFLRQSLTNANSFHLGLCCHNAHHTMVQIAKYSDFVSHNYVAITTFPLNIQKPYKYSIVN